MVLQVLEQRVVWLKSDQVSSNAPVPPFLDHVRWVGLRTGYHHVRGACRSEVTGEGQPPFLHRCRLHFHSWFPIPVQAVKVSISGEQMAQFTLPSLGLMVRTFVGRVCLGTTVACPVGADDAHRGDCRGGRLFPVGTARGVGGHAPRWSYRFPVPCIQLDPALCGPPGSTVRL